MTKPNAVEYFGFVDRARGELFVLALKSAEYNWDGLHAVRHSLDVFRLFPGFPEGVNPRDQSVGEIEDHGGNGLRGVSRKKTLERVDS